MEGTDITPLKVSTDMLQSMLRDVYTAAMQTHELPIALQCIQGMWEIMEPQSTERGIGFGTED